MIKRQSEHKPGDSLLDVSQVRYESEHRTLKNMDTPADAAALEYLLLLLAPDGLAEDPPHRPRSHSVFIDIDAVPFEEGYDLLR